MTRVDENREAQRAAEARRQQEADKAKQKGNAEQFQKLVGKQEQVSKEAVKKQGNQNASNALVARQGIVQRNFAQSLQQHGQASNDKARADVKARRDDVNSKELTATEKRDKQDTEALGRRDQLAPISGEEKREQGGGLGGGGSGGSHTGEQSGEMAGGRASEVAGLAAPMQASQAQQAQASGSTAPRIPPEVIQALVNRVFAGVTPEGLSQFTIELKGDVLGGARLDIVAENGKISCTVHTNDKHVGNLIKASQGQLARAFAHKGLSLERLAVEQG